MYRLTNLSLDTATIYKNKDLVYQALERENAKMRHQEAEGLLLVEELDKKGVVIYQEDIYLPFEGIADSLFLKSGTTTHQKESQSNQKWFWTRSRDKNSQKPSPKEKQELRKTVSDIETQSIKGKSLSSFLKVLWQGLLLVGMGVSLTIAGFTTSLSLKQEKELSYLNQQVKQLETLQSQTGRLDAFARYFLPHYFSEQGKLDDFMSPKLEFKHPSGQLQSVILESVSQIEDQTYQLTYVLAVKEGENRTQTRLTLTVKAVSMPPYGYQIIKIPKQTNYPK
ncbi:hypothetical protein ACVRZ9_06645 [Streptococcus dysgalactiae subsp. equisimilis]|uniref:hypothetical protein n=1 Tax=Streptococcus TaxID=1301 RepID=UPI0002BB39DD|nr:MULTISPECIES: hypothetical protein [Streptococcus]HEP3126444.1 hypothetical protein [Streptococcus pyogenes]EPT37499.1 hypothetical protein SAG0029_00415 [Streptococcus agalactiae FSL S3-501]KKC22829.1 hypothetical protein WH79_04450 [Streptococcus dysgalactiae subsp. equisimilis]MCB2845995.1 hypothetical protein [Streptococcus dysgalactiae subsp. dysgalactiae]HEP3352374.1 hypothetical protein [Streptococcus pyogenes]